MIRSLLYVPGNTPRFLEKAAGRGADAIIIDLEDSVPDAGKTGARDALAGWVPTLRSGGATIFVRVNSGDRLVEDARVADSAGADGILVPKVNDAATLVDLHRHLSSMRDDGPPLGLVPMIEHPAGLLDVRAIAAAPGVMALTVGEEDLATAMDARPTPEVLRLPKLMVHYAAKAAGLLSFGLFHGIADYADTDAVRRAALEARAFGFDGAACIHPMVVPILNEAFSPTPAEIDWSRRVVAAARAQAAAGCGAFTLDGRFIDSPVVARAKRLLRGLAHGGG